MDPDQNASVCFFWHQYDRKKEGENGGVKIDENDCVSWQKRKEESSYYEPGIRWEDGRGGWLKSRGEVAGRNGMAKIGSCGSWSIPGDNGVQCENWQFLSSTSGRRKWRNYFQWWNFRYCCTLAAQCNNPLGLFIVERRVRCSKISRIILYVNRGRDFCFIFFSSFLFCALFYSSSFLHVDAIVGDEIWRCLEKFWKIVCHRTIYLRGFISPADSWIESGVIKSSIRIRVRERTCLHINSLTHSLSLALRRFITVHCTTVDSSVSANWKKYCVIGRIPFPLLGDLVYPTVFYNVVTSSLENLPSRNTIDEKSTGQRIVSYKSSVTVRLTVQHRDKLSRLNCGVLVYCERTRKTYRRVSPA